VAHANVIAINGIMINQIISVQAVVAGSVCLPPLSKVGTELKKDISAGAELPKEFQASDIATWLSGEVERSH